MKLVVSAIFFASLTLGDTPTTSKTREQALYEQMASEAGIPIEDHSSATSSKSREIRTKLNRMRATQILLGEEPSSEYKQMVQELKDFFECKEKERWFCGSYENALTTLEKILLSSEFRWSHYLTKGFVKRFLDMCRPESLQCRTFVPKVLDRLTPEAVSPGIVEGLIGVLDDPSLRSDAKVRILESINANPWNRSQDNAVDRFILKIAPDTRPSFFEPIYNALKAKNEEFYPYGSGYNPAAVNRAALQALKRIGLVD